MKDVLLALCVGAAMLAGLPLARGIDRWIDRHVSAGDAADPDEAAPGRSSQNSDLKPNLPKRVDVHSIMKGKREGWR